MTGRKVLENDGKSARTFVIKVENLLPPVWVEPYGESGVPVPARFQTCLVFFAFFCCSLAAAFSALASVLEEVEEEELSEEADEPALYDFALAAPYPVFAFPAEEREGSSVPTRVAVPRQLQRSPAANSLPQ